MAGYSLTLIQICGESSAFLVVSRIKDSGKLILTLYFKHTAGKIGRTEYASSMPKETRLFDQLGAIQVLRHQRGGWVGSENGNF